MDNQGKRSNLFVDGTAALRTFLAGTVAELKKCTWPPRKELFESTILVIVAMTILTLYVFLNDLIDRGLISLVTR